MVEYKLLAKILLYRIFLNFGRRIASDILNFVILITNSNFVIQKTSKYQRIKVIEFFQLFNEIISIIQPNYLMSNIPTLLATK